MYIDPIQADKEKRLSQGFEFARETSYKATLSPQKQKAILRTQIHRL